MCGAEFVVVWSNLECSQCSLESAGSSEASAPAEATNASYSRGAETYSTSAPNEEDGCTAPDMRQAEHATAGIKTTCHTRGRLILSRDEFSSPVRCCRALQAAAMPACTGRAKTSPKSCNLQVQMPAQWCKRNASRVSQRD